MMIATDNETIGNVMKWVAEQIDIIKRRPTVFLGLMVEETATGYFVSQLKHVDKVLNTFGMTKYNPEATPMVVKQVFDKFDDSEWTPALDYQRNSEQSCILDNVHVRTLHTQ